MAKRTDYLSWDEAIMKVAFTIAQRSKDPNTQVGCCIVDSKHRFVGVGYNGLPRGCSDDEFPWSKSDDGIYNNKYGYVVHAEQNAILNSNNNLDGTKIYVTQHPCNECAKFIIQSGIIEVIYQNNPRKDTDSVKAAVRMFSSADIMVRQINQ